MKTLILFFLFTHNSYANTPIAEVVKIRGTVSQLSPVEKTARPLLLGDKLLEDTSVLTSAKSFVKIKFIDNSELNIGPESKIVISEMKKDTPGVISLLKGRIRTEVQKDSAKNENKFFIKTRTAAMGVRGTDFQTIYNPDNKTTSLLTFKGEVALAKMEENETTLLSEKLATKEAVLVPPGQSSFTNDVTTKSTLPVKISPVQLNALYKNQEFSSKPEINSANNKMEELKIAEQKAPAEGLNNTKTGDFAPKSGGFIDLETGIYVAPDATAVLDKKSGVYVSKKNGNVDVFTGQYIPPEGLVLDAKKGFIVDDNQGSKTKDLVALRNDLNKVIVASETKTADPIIEQKEIEPPYDLNSKFAKTLYSIGVKQQRLTIALNENEHNRPYYTMAFRSFSTISLDMETESTNRYRAIYNLSYANNHSASTPGSLFAVSGGVKYALTKRFNLFSTLGIKQDHFLVQTSNSTYPYTYSLNRIVYTQMSLGVQGEFFTDRMISLDTKIQILPSFRKRLNGIVVDSGGGISINIDPKYKMDEHQWLTAGLAITSNDQYISNEFGSNKHNRHSVGGEIRFIWENE